MDILSLEKLFAAVYERPPEFVAKAPGRVNLLGEHTDYNDGFVLPIAVNRATFCAAAFRDDKKISLVSAQKERRIDSNAGNVRKTYSWADYPIGVLDAFVTRGFQLRGMDLFFWSDVPLGAGLSSSASIEAATARIINDSHGFELSNDDLIQIAHAAEAEFVGVPCGVMDQFVSIVGQKDHALLLDCRSLESQQIPLNLGGHVLLIIDSKKARTLATSKYKERRIECEKAIRHLKSYMPEISNLRDVDLEDFESVLGVVQSIPAYIARRARHVLAENLRVKAGVDALTRGDLSMFGSLMFESHVSLKENYEVSCAELDFLVDQVLTFNGGVGARLTGAGFGGCTVNLVRRELADEVQQRVERSYQEKFGIKPAFYLTTANNGAELIRKT